MKKFFEKSFLALLAFAFCGIPTWIYLGIRSLASPSGFWQEIVIAGLGAWVLGGLQIVLVFVFLALMFLLLFSD